MLPRGLSLFFADVIDVDTQRQYFYYVVGRDYDSAFKRFTKEMNKCFRLYDYYFNEVEDEIELKIYAKSCTVKAGVYLCDQHFLH